MRREVTPPSPVFAPRLFASQVLCLAYVLQSALERHWPLVPNWLAFANLSRSWLCISDMFKSRGISAVTFDITNQEVLKMPASSPQHRLQLVLKVFGPLTLLCACLSVGTGRSWISNVGWIIRRGASGTGRETVLNSTVFIMIHS